MISYNKKTVHLKVNQNDFGSFNHPAKLGLFHVDSNVLILVRDRKAIFTTISLVITFRSLLTFKDKIGFIFYNSNNRIVTTII